jgi:hypothetical protein
MFGYFNKHFKNIQSKLLSLRSIARYAAVAKYAADNDLRGGTTTVREEDVGKLTGARASQLTCAARCSELREQFS